MEAEEGTHHGESVQHDSSKDNVTVFVSNLDFTLQEERLQQVFEKVCSKVFWLYLS